MKILIASAHLRAPKAKLWRDLQKKYVDRHTDVEYEYAVVANNINPDLFEANLVLHLPESPHRTCINAIIDLFTDRDDFTHLLLLDSDAWPVRPWVNILIGMMGDRLYSAPMRVENYDDFPHPSAFFMKREMLDLVKFEGRRDYFNLLGDQVSDVGVSMPQDIDGTRIWIPLVKTNIWSPHPMFAAVYGDLFYHHGGGSRKPGIRLAGTGIYDHILQRSDHKKIYNRVTQLLKKDPDLFINRLRGKDGFPKYR